MSSSSASATKPCPHCGGTLDRGLAEHMARGHCGGYDSPATVPTSTTNDLPERYEELPLLEEHDQRDHADHDLDERRELAEKLAETGDWP